MNFSRKIILIAAITLAISLGTACSFFDAAPEVNHQKAEPTTTSEANNSALPPENGAANNAAAVHPQNVAELGLDASATKAEQAYQEATTAAGYFVSLLADKNEDDARWALAKLGATDILSYMSDIPPDAQMDVLLSKPQNQAALYFIQSFPQEEVELLNKLEYPRFYDPERADRWDDEQTLNQDTKLIVTLYGNAMANHPTDTNGTGTDPFGWEEDTNRLLTQITGNLTYQFINDHHYTLVAVEKDEEDDTQMEATDLPMQFTEPEHEQVTDMITTYFDQRLEAVEVNIHEALNQGNAEKLAAAVMELRSMQEQNQKFQDFDNANFPPMDSPEQRAELEDLYGAYRDKLIPAMLAEAAHHVTDEVTLHDAMNHIEVRPNSILDEKIKSEWLWAYHPEFMAAAARMADNQN